MYIALVRVGEISGTLDSVLEMLGTERARSEQMRRKLTDAMHGALSLDFITVFEQVELPQSSST
jgi:hypothetical protein